MKSAKLLSKKWTSCSSQLCDIRKNISRVCKQLAYSEKETNAIVLAIDEASSNIMRYGYKNCIDGEIMIEISTDHQHAIFRLHDHAQQVTDDCIKATPSSPLEPGGLGILIMQEVMDSVRFVHTDNCPGNILEMRINLPKENH